jgi:hypothetical protein
MKSIRYRNPSNKNQETPEDSMLLFSFFSMAGGEGDAIDGFISGELE